MNPFPIAGIAMAALVIAGCGETRDWFMVLRDGKGIGGNPPMLNNTVELEPGEYDVSVNKTIRKVKIDAGKKVVLLTGSLVVEGSSASWWYPEQAGERKVSSNPPVPGRALALFPGTYSVHAYVKNKTEKITESVQVSAGQKTALKR